MSTKKIIPAISGTRVIDSSVVPYIREKQLEFIATDLKPNKTANFFFDDSYVGRFVQRPSVLTTSSNTTDYSLERGDRLYNATTCAFASVVDISPNNTIYLNENYVSTFLSGAAFNSTDYSVGDIVYQNNTQVAGSNAASNTFLGRVEYWDSTQQNLVLSVINGSLSNTSGANGIFKVSGRIANVSHVLGNTATQRFVAGQNIVPITHPSNNFTVATYTNYSGQIVTVDGLVASINISSNAPSTIVGNTIAICSGNGIGQIRTVTAVDGNKLTLNTSLTVAVAGNSKYTLTQMRADSYGKLCGIFNIPEDPLLRFKTGERLFVVTDSSTYSNTDSGMKAASKYVASGLLNRSNEIRTTPTVMQIPTPRPGETLSFTNTLGAEAFIKAASTDALPSKIRKLRDPMAQTFFTPKPKSVKQNYGIFVSSIDLFFKAKPLESDGKPQLPITVQIVTTNTGFPTRNQIGSATVFPSKVNVSDGSVTLPSASDSTTVTKFTFTDPVYLEPDTEYALVVITESPDYELWISEIGQSILGTSRRVSEQPYAGKFFRAQNALTWTPFENQDLMFVINKAVFSTTPVNVMYKSESPATNIFVDKFIVQTSDLDFPSANIKYRCNTTIAADLSRDASYFEVVPNEVVKFGEDLKNSSKENKRRRIIREGVGSSWNVQVTLSTTDPDISPMLNDERFSLICFENNINYGEITNSAITITSGGGHHTLASDIVVAFSAPQIEGGVTATANVMTSGLVSGNVVALNIINPGSGYTQSPTITITDPTVSGFANATAVAVSENDTHGGNGISKYISRKVVLADAFDAGDLRVFLQAVRPQGTEVLVYYKVRSGTDSDSFDNKKWQQMYIVQNIYSVDQQNVVDLQFRPSLSSGKLSYVENGVEYPLGGTFKEFAIKIVTFAEDPTVVPVLKNLRAIATPEG